MTEFLQKSAGRKPANRIARRVVALMAAAVVGVIAPLLVAAPAMAHNFYIESTPAIDEVLTTLPDEFIVTTNDNLLDLDGAVASFIMVVTGPDGLYYGDGCVTVQGASVSMPAALGPAGDYTLDWQVVSADGHTVSDSIPFQWQPAAGQEPTAQGTSTVPTCGGEAVTPPDTSTTGASDEAMTAILWIGGAVLAVALAVVVTLLLLRPKKNGDTEESPKGTPKE